MSELRNIRRARGLTQEDLALVMNTTGVSISRYERDERKLTLTLLRRLASALDCDISDIIGNDSNPSTVGRNKSAIRWIDHYRLDHYHHFLNDSYTDTEPLPDVPVLEAWLEKLEVSGISDLVIVNVVNSGDAMSPMLKDRDYVLLDRNVKSFRRDGVYLILSGEYPEFRRLAKNPTAQTISVLSEHPAHPDYDNVPIEKLEILGLAVWHCSPL